MSDDPNKASITFVMPSAGRIVAIAVGAFSTGALTFLAAHNLDPTQTARSLAYGAIVAGMSAILQALHLYTPPPGSS